MEIDFTLKLPSFYQKIKPENKWLMGKKTSQIQGIKIKETVQMKSAPLAIAQKILLHM